MSQFASRAIALLLVVLVVAPAASPVGTASAAPDGFVGVPDTNVVDDFPVGANSSLTAADLEGSVMASDHAESLQVVVTTPERASEYVNGSRVGSGQLALVFKDDTHHEGREVAVPADAVREALGRVPKVVHGVHDDGESWTEPVDARNGLLFFQVPKFSSNAVSFEGEVSIQATAVDGSQFSPDVGSPDSLEDFHINVTGDTATEWDNVSVAALGNGETLTTNVAGTEDPRGSEVIFTGEIQVTSESVSKSWVSPTSSHSLSLDSNIDPADGSLSVTAESDRNQAPNADDSSAGYMFDENVLGEIKVVNPPRRVDKVTLYKPDSVTCEFNVYLADGEGPDGNYLEGTQIASNVDANDGSSTVIFDASGFETSGDVMTVGYNTTGSYCGGGGKGIVNSGGLSNGLRLDAPQGITNSDEEVKIDVTAETPSSLSASTASTSKTLGSFGSGETKTVGFSLSKSDSSLDFSGSGGYFDFELSYSERTATENPGVDIDGDGTDDVSHSGILLSGETATYPATNLGLSDDSLTISTASGSTVDVAVNLQEVTETVNPAVLVNGHRTGGATVGTLAEGETAQLNANTDWIRDGVNNVTVTVGDGTLSADAPSPQVKLDYHHTAAVQASTSYVANGWEESYKVNHTYAGDRQNATVRIPFSRTVYDMQNIEYRVNGGSWSDVSQPNWKLSNGTELVVNVEDTDSDPSFEAGDTVAVRTAGEKVQAVNGAITVTDPTTPSDPTLDAGFRIDTWSPGFRLEVGQTYKGERVHYTYKESWDADEEAVLSADGSQTLYLPDATVGGTARVTTIPLEVSPSSGDVGIHVVDPDDPELEIGPGKSGFGSDVTYEWYGATDGNTYGLYSVSRGRYLDKQDASNGFVALVDDDSEETLLIQKPGAGGSNSPGAGGGGGGGDSSGIWDQSGPDTTLQEMGVVIGWAAFAVLLIAATGRSDLTGRRRWLVVGAVSGGTGLFSLEILRPGTVSGAIGSGLEEIVPLAGLAAVGLGIYSVVTWWQARKKEASTPETKVTFDVGGADD